MAWSISFNPELKVIEVKSSGTWDAEQDARMLQELKSKSDQHTCQLYLIDHSEAKLNFRLIAIYDRPTIYEQLNITKKARAALIMDKIGEDHLFFENVCVNRGFNVRVFDSRDNAVEWLLSDVSRSL